MRRQHRLPLGNQRRPQFFVAKLRRVGHTGGMANHAHFLVNLLARLRRLRSHDIRKQQSATQHHQVQTCTRGQITHHAGYLFGNHHTRVRARAGLI